MCGFLINGNDITSLDSLSILHSIQGDLLINSNDGLINLAGLQELTSIGEDLKLNPTTS